MQLNSSAVCSSVSAAPSNYVLLPPPPLRYWSSLSGTILFYITIYEKLSFLDQCIDKYNEIAYLNFMGYISSLYEVYFVIFPLSTRTKWHYACRKKNKNCLIFNFVLFKLIKNKKIKILIDQILQGLIISLNFNYNNRKIAWLHLQKYLLYIVTISLPYMVFTYNDRSWFTCMYVIVWVINCILKWIIVQSACKYRTEIIYLRFFLIKK